MGACHRTSNRQEHKIIRRAEPERDTIFHLRVTACRGRGSHCQDERLAWVASRGQGTSCSSSFVSKVLGANYKSLEESIDKGKGGIGNGSDLEKHPRLAYISFLFASTKLFA